MLVKPEIEKYTTSIYSQDLECVEPCPHTIYTPSSCCMSEHLTVLPYIHTTPSRRMEEWR
jgi:hypothetical protein